MNYLERIRDIFEHLDETRDSVVVEVNSNRDVFLEPRDQTTTPVATGLDKRYRFTNFVRGKSNDLAYAAAQQVAQKPGLGYNTLLLYGGTG